MSAVNTQKKEYDIAIIGGGIGGLMCAVRITETDPDKRVVVIEKGADLDSRVCPVVKNGVRSCAKCARCAIMEGMAGAGAFSDGKYVISTEYGGWLTDYLPERTVLDYIEQADAILVKNGASTDRYRPSNELKKRCIMHDLHMAQAELKHLGTDANFTTMKRLIASLEGKCDIMTHTEVIDVDRDSHVVTAVINSEKIVIEADYIVFAVGRAGARFMADWCRRSGVALHNNQVDIGVRVELPAIIWEDFSRVIYEPKILYRSKQYGDHTRMFCFNDRGSVVLENTGGVLTVNGHSYRDERKKTANSNFALLTTIRFTSPFDEPIEYARFVASLANKISGGSVLVQRLGDLESGKRTNEHRLAASSTVPTLSAVPGDLSLCMPKRQLDNILETLHALDRVAPGTANYDTLLYGIECKYYSARPEASLFELAGCDRIYALGDGAGFTRSLSHAAANGLFVADRITGGEQATGNRR